MLLLAALPGGLPAQTRITGVAIAGHRLDVEVVSDPEAMQLGLMFREHLPDGAGMLFAYPQSQPLSFWMRNTRLPLSIAFLSEDRLILNIEDMEPFDETTRHRSAGNARYALEVNQGWFRKRGIGPGERVHFLKTVVSGGGGAR